MNRLIGLVAVAVVLATGASFAVAAGGPFTKEIKARQGLMQLSGFNLGVLASMAKGKRDYDPKIAAAAAKNLHMAAMMDGSLIWPKGSDLTNKELTQKTAAKPEAWMKGSKVGEKHMAWVEASAVLAKVAGNGLDALKPAVGKVGKSCKGCHDDYRKKKK